MNVTVQKDLLVTDVGVTREELGVDAHSFCLNQAMLRPGGLGQFLKIEGWGPNKPVFHEVGVMPTTLGHGNTLTHASVEP